MTSDKRHGFSFGSTLFRMKSINNIVMSILDSFCSNDAIYLESVY